MQDKDFDSLLRRKFEYQDLRAHQEEKWVDLTERLDAFHQQRRRRSMLLYAFGVAALLLGNLAWLFYWLGSSSPRTSSSPEPVVKRDTLFQTIHIVRYDTIYRTVMLENNISDPGQSVYFGDIQSPGLSSKPNFNKRSLATFESPQVSNGSRETTSVAAVNGAGSNPTLTGSNTNTPIPSVQAKTPAAVPNVLSPLKPLKPGLLPLDQRTFIPLIRATTLRSNDILQEQDQSPPEEPAERKSSFRWQPIWVNGAHLLVFPGSLEGYVVTSGLQMERNISNRIALGGSLRVGLASAESSDISRIPSLDHTAPAQPGPAYIFRHWDVDFMPLIQYQLYGHLRIASLGKTRLMAGAGTQWISTMPYNIEYQYVNMDTFDEVDLESEINMETRWQGLSLMLQAERPLGKKIAFGTRVNGLVPHRTLQTVLDQSLGLDFWLKFRL